MYSGFTRDEAYDKDSRVNKKWTNTNIDRLIEGGVLSGVNAGWFNSDGSYNNALYPNAIDAAPFFDRDGKLWMAYGSWSGGIFLLELDPATGRPIFNGKDGTTADGRLVDRYFGTKIAGGYTKSGEGPYIVYDRGISRACSRLTPATFSLGVNWWDPPFKGMLDELRIYDIPVTEAVIRKLAEEKG